MAGVSASSMERMIVGKYELLEKLGKGGFAVAYKAQNVENNRLYAVKVGQATLQCDQMDTSNELDRNLHLKEWKAYEKLDHGQNDANKRGIPRVYETGLVKLTADSMRTYLVMQLLGRNVGSLVRRQGGLRDKPELFVRYGMGMLLALRFMHSRRLVHRDVKPSNFCIPLTSTGDDPRVYVLDLGFTQEFTYHDDECYDTFLGTPDYASTDGLMGYKQAPKDDLESLGYTLLEMWLSELPWSLTTNSAAASGWTADDLMEMAEKRRKLWAKLAAAGRIPKFLVSWQEYVGTLTRNSRGIKYSWLLHLIYSVHDPDYYDPQWDGEDSPPEECIVSNMAAGKASSTAGVSDTMGGTNFSFNSCAPNGSSARFDVPGKQCTSDKSEKRQSTADAGHAMNALSTLSGDASTAHGFHTSSVGICDHHFELSGLKRYEMPQPETRQQKKKQKV